MIMGPAKAYNHICPQCSKGYASDYVLQRHIRAIHQVRENEMERQLLK